MRWEIPENGESSRGMGSADQQMNSCSVWFSIDIIYLNINYGNIFAHFQTHYKLNLLFITLHRMVLDN